MADETFESVDAGASETIPMEAGQIKKGGYICIKGRPCKVVSVSTSKTGKHGHNSDSEQEQEEDETALSQTQMQDLAQTLMQETLSNM